MSETVRFELDGAVACIVLDRPAARNALSAEMDAALGEALARADADPGVRAIILKSSSSEWFCAGGDLRELLAGRPWGVGRGGGLTGIEGPQRVLRTPLIAQVSGPAVGIGAELALCADIIIASETAWFSVPEVPNGLVGGPGVMHRLIRQLPQRIATAMILTGRRLDTEDAARYGLVNEVVPVSAVDEAVQRWGDDLVGASAEAVSAALQAIRIGSQLTLDQALTARYPLTESYAASADYQEARRAVAERRAPRWVRQG